MKKWIVWGFGATIFGALLVALLLPGDVLSTRLVGQWGVRIPVARGELFTIPRVVLPAQQIELCSDVWFKKATCVSLPGSVTGTQTVTAIPPKANVGRALLKVTEPTLTASRGTSSLQGRAFVTVTGSKPAASTVKYRQALYVVDPRQSGESAGEHEPETGTGSSGGGAPPQTQPATVAPFFPTSPPSTPEPSATPNATPGV